MNPSQILVAYDHSEAAQRALAYAIDLTESGRRHGGSPLTVIHVYEQANIVIGDSFFTLPANVLEAYEEQAQNVLVEAKKIIGDKREAEFVLRQGAPARTILEYAEQHSFELIVVGSRGLGGIKEFVLGSVSHNIVQNAKIPVLVVK